MGTIAQEENKRQTQENPLLYPTNNDKKPGREGDSQRTFQRKSNKKKGKEKLATKQWAQCFPKNRNTLDLI